LNLSGSAGATSSTPATPSGSRATLCTVASAPKLCATISVGRVSRWRSDRHVPTSAADRAFPVILLHPLERGEQALPAALPVVRSAVMQTGRNQHAKPAKTLAMMITC
jgi:hypothetical protein